MKLQADATTYLLDSPAPFYVNGNMLGLAEVLDRATIDCLRVSFFAPNSPLLPVQRTLDLFGQAGMQQKSLYLCVHCSDTWADPSHQDIPASWNFSNIKQLKSCFIDYLISIFEAVQSTNINVRYVQVGNEISNGLLWPYLSSPYEYVDFIKTAHYLCRQYFPSARIVLHTDLSYSAEKACEWYALMEKRKVDYDLVGLSYYPVWHGPLKQLKKTVTDVAQLTGKKIILCEIGYMHTEQKTSAWFGHWKCDDIPYSPEGQQAYLKHFSTFIQHHIRPYLHPEMFYWGMCSYNNEEHYPVALFDPHGHALPAFYDINRGVWEQQ